jgi:hypothetical protein
MPRSSWLVRPLPGRAGAKLLYAAGDKPQSFMGTLLAWRDDPAVALAFARAIAELACDGVYWECPVLCSETFHVPFECVILDAPHFQFRQSNAGAFAN